MQIVVPSVESPQLVKVPLFFPSEVDQVMSLLTKILSLKQNEAKSTCAESVNKGVT